MSLLYFIWETLAPRRELDKKSWKVSLFPGRAASCMCTEYDQYLLLLLHFYPFIYPHIP